MGDSDPRSQRLSAQTVVGLFDDQIDAEHALSALKKSIEPAASVSVLARDRRIKDDRPESAVDVTKAVVDTAMTAVTGWLTGLASLMVPDLGHLLAAGPIGAMLAKIRPEPVDHAENAQPERPAAESVGRVGQTLEQFGFRPEEAHYIEQRLAAGSSIIAVTASEQDQIERALRTFGDQNAVFIGQAETPGEIVAEAEQGLLRPANSASTEIIVSDVVVPMHRICNGGESELTGVCGRDVFDDRGTQLGEVDDLFVEEATGELRYVIVGHGGVFGIARRRYAVPASVVNIEMSPLRVALADRKFGDLESFDPDEPFSRRIETAVCSFFDITPYWVE
jgi:sporulation protein YlmC with PRC-barrel domain